ncbi:MAG: PorT family protein [Muribaculaceae bacterium]|nr:PorT family protein [Muribaculaceae bacterium]
MKRIFTAIMGAMLALTATAADFFSTEECDDLFTLGARIGVNTSNRTVNPAAAGSYSYQSWGTGFTVGATASLNVRDYLSIEPGIFFESRSGHSTFTSDPIPTEDGLCYVAQSAHRHSYNFTIPVLASVRFNITDALRWHVDFGPYVAFKLKSKLENKELLSTRPDIDNVAPFAGEAAPVDFGFKMGTAFELFRKYYLGVHYEAGAVKAYKDHDLGAGIEKIYGGRTKAWNFTIGLNF